MREATVSSRWLVLHSALSWAVGEDVSQGRPVCGRVP